MAIPVADLSANQGHVNAPSDGVMQGLYETSTTQKGPVGARRVLSDGRVYRYSYFVGAANRGTLVAQDATSQTVAETAATTVRNSAGTAADISSSDNVNTLYLLDTDTITAANSNDVFAGGYLHVINSDVGGYTYKIRGNTYTASTSVMAVDLYDNIVADISSESELAITGNPYNYLQIYNNGTDDVIAGVSIMTQAADSYGWVQTWGIGTVLADESAGTIAAGTIAQGSDGVNGAAQPFGGGATNSESDHSYDTEPVIGYFISAATNGNHTPIFLQLAP